METKEIFAVRLKELMKEKDIQSLRSLSKQINIPNETISSWMTCKFLPTAENLITLADFFHCSIDYLLGRSEFEDLR